MKVTILEPSGYCAGVDRAINLAIQTKQNNMDQNVVVLGMLVHNEDSLLTLKKHNISTIYKKGSSLEELVNEVKEPSIVILTAHGHSKHIEDLLIKNGHTIVDATCPFVLKSMSDIKNEISLGNPIFYIGVTNHPEANAALSISDNVYLLDIKDVKIPELDIKSPTILTQTTLSEFEVKHIEELILEKYPNAKMLKGVCNASTSRQKALLNVDEDVDAILVVGGTNSNNSKTLYNLAKSNYPNKKVYLIQNANDLKEKDLVGLNHIAISSGASTPKHVIEQIKSKLLN